MQLELLPYYLKPASRGKLIVIEGSDGAGKATQLQLLKTYLEKQKIPVKTIDFPRYATSFYGKMIASFLHGDYGGLNNIHPHLISVVYAMDRADAKKQMDKWLKGGNIILSNRYATSNMAHQTARLPVEEREAFLAWEEELEYTLNRIPREDLVIYLYVPYRISQELILKKEKAQREYVKGKPKDLVEADLEYLKKSEDAYLALVQRFPHWVMVDCIDQRGKLKSKEDIHEEIKKVLIKRNFL